MTSPFKFLDSYAKEDKAIFFGREQEADQLYQLVSTSDIVLLYGPSGTGKTSLIQCGLGNRIRETDWLPVFVRRRHDVNQSLREDISRLARTPIPDDASLTKAVRSLYLDYLRPIYLIFDQFEELFVLGTAEEERTFVEAIAAVLAADIGCKVIISLREEYLARLYAFEEKIPELFETRLRVETMSMTNVEKVILGTADKLGITLEHGAATARKIIANLSEDGRGVQLAYLQVYLDRLYRLAGPAESGSRVEFTDALVEKSGRLDDVLADFLETQTTAIQHALEDRQRSSDPETVQHILEMFATLEGTKHPMSRSEVAARRPDLEPVLDEVLMALRQARILRDADGLYELAHDSLAGRIADRRGAASKNLLRLRKIVQDRISAFSQKNRTYLSGQELTLLRPYRKQLNLAPDEDRFIRRSGLAIVYMWIRRIVAYLVVGGLLAGVLVVILLLNFGDPSVPKPDPTDPKTAGATARTLVDQGQFQQAVEALKPAIDAHPTDRSLLFQRADVYWRLGRDDLAIAQYDAIRGTFNGSSAVLNQLCWYQAIRGINLPQAMDDCNKAIGLADGKDSRAFVLLREGHHDREALAAYNDAISLRPDSETSLYGRGVAYMRLNQRDKAARDIAAAQRLDPRIAERFQTWGVTLPGEAAPAGAAHAEPLPIYNAMTKK